MADTPSTERKAFEAAMRQEGMNDRELEKNEHGKYVDLTMRWAYAAWQARAALSAPAPITAEQLVRVSAQGVHFGNAWFSHERITGYTAEQLNAGHCKVTGGAYMEWVRAALSAPVAAPPADPLLGQALQALVRYANAFDADAKTVAVIQALEARIDAAPVFHLRSFGDVTADELERLTAAPPAASEREVLQRALAALETAHTGLMWYRGMMPEYVDGSDDEADEEITAAIEVARTHLSTALTEDTK